jgi:ribonuclease Z
MGLTWVQMVSTPTADSPGTSLLFHHDHCRYLFGNVHEGLQRLMVQQRTSMGRLEELFISGPINWHSVGGLLGMTLTLADQLDESRVNKIAGQQAKGKKRNAKDSSIDIPDQPTTLRFHGGRNLKHVLATARRFIFRKGLPIHTNEVKVAPSRHNSEPDWQDVNIKVWYVPLSAAPEEVPASSESSANYAEATIPTDESKASASQDHSMVPAEDPYATDEEILDAIVQKMFGSDWQFDALVETKLHDVMLPAKLFVKDAENKLQPYRGPLPGDRPDVPNVTVFVRKPWPATLYEHLPPTTPSKQSMCYIVRNQDSRGKFNAEKAKNLGILGRDCSILTKGQNVIAPDGTLVTPEMVMGDTVAGRGFAVLDLPNKSYVDSLLKQAEWKDSEIMKHINVMYWLLGPGLHQDDRLRAFMEAVTKEYATHHIVASHDTCANHYILKGSAALQRKLSQLDPGRFSGSVYSNISPLGAKLDNLPFEVAVPGVQFQFSPRFERMKAEGSGLFGPWLPHAQLPEELVPAARELENQLKDPTFLQSIEDSEKDIPCRDAEIIPLGTGSALPSKYRNVSATLIRVPGVGSYLFDCGENTLGSIRRMFGHQKADEILKELRAIWLSHLHADHHLGTASIIRAWRDATAMDEATKSNRLVVATHKTMLGWLREYAAIEEYGHDRLRLVEMKVPEHGRVDAVCQPFEFSPEETSECGLTKIAAATVDHCNGAMATVFEWPSGLKIAYSGDCRPSDAFVEIGQGATLLIHEATFDDELGIEALAKKHSTISEAIGVGQRMGARRVLLTHFSQRYPKISMTKALGDDNDMAVVAAVDQMSIKLGDFRKAQLFMPAMQRMLELDEDAKAGAKEKRRQAMTLAEQAKSEKRRPRAVEQDSSPGHSRKRSIASVDVGAQRSRDGSRERPSSSYSKEGPGSRNAHRSRSQSPRSRSPKGNVQGEDWSGAA